jgi:hypothetical protein
VALPLIETARGTTADSADRDSTWQPLRRWGRRTGAVDAGYMCCMCACAAGCVCCWQVVLAVCVCAAYVLYCLCWWWFVLMPLLVLAACAACHNHDAIYRPSSSRGVSFARCLSTRSDAPADSTTTSETSTTCGTTCESAHSLLLVVWLCSHRTLFE